MDRIRRSIRQSFRRSKKVPSSASSGDTSQPAQWQNDEAAVRAGNCSFQVKYLGCIEVFESRGMQICEEALKQLRQSNRKTQRAVLHISGDGLRVDDATSSQLIVDQTIEKVSFCAPDRNHDRGFSYICRDGATRRWLCHGFIAVRESKATLQGERLSHAVGCAFQICLEKKQKRDRETAQPASTPAPSSQTESASIHHYPSSTVHATPPRSASSLPFTNHSAPSSASPFTRQSSARMSSIADRMKDPQEYKAASPPPPPIKTVVNPHMRDRPHVTPQMLQRQQSLRTLSTLNSATPFKRNMSLESRADPAEVVRSAKWRQMSVDVPSVMQQNQQQLMPVYRGLVNSNVPTWEDGSAIMDPDALPEESEELTDEVSRLCQQMSFDLSMMSASANHVVNGFPHSSASATAHSNGPAPGSGPYALLKSMSSPFPPDKRPPPGSAREARAKFAERSPFSRTVHPPLPAVNGHRLFTSMRDTDRQGTAVNPTIDWSDKDPFNTDNVNWVNLSKTSTNPFVV